MKKLRAQQKFHKIRLVSYSGGLRSLPSLEEEVSQSLTIHRDGRVWFSGYTYAEDYLSYNRCRGAQFKLEADKAEEIFEAFQRYFSGAYVDSNVMDAGLWELGIMNEAGETAVYKGSLCDSLVVDGCDLSDLVRRNLERPDLWVFDGKSE